MGSSSVSGGLNSTFERAKKAARTSALKVNSPRCGRALAFSLKHLAYESWPSGATSRASIGPRHKSSPKSGGRKPISGWTQLLGWPDKSRRKCSHVECAQDDPQGSKALASAAFSVAPSGGCVEDGRTCQTSSLADDVGWSANAAERQPMASTGRAMWMSERRHSTPPSSRCPSRGGIALPASCRLLYSGTELLRRCMHHVSSTTASISALVK